MNVAIALDYLHVHTCVLCGGAIDKDERFDFRRACDCNVVHRQEFAQSTGYIESDIYEHGYSRTKEDHRDT
jgi:hypothetical protein